MSRTLPLFGDLEAGRPCGELEMPAGAEGGPSQPSASQSGAGKERPAHMRAMQDANAAGGDRHLQAAWRLARAMRRFPDRSAQQTRAGLAICHHLHALLAESESRTP